MSDDKELKISSNVVVTAEGHTSEGIQLAIEAQRNSDGIVGLRARAEAAEQRAETLENEIIRPALAVLHRVIDGGGAWPEAYSVIANAEAYGIEVQRARSKTEGK